MATRGRKQRINRDKLQRYLLTRADSRNIVYVNHLDLAEKLNIANPNLSIIFHKMVNEGRIRRHHRKKAAGAYWYVYPLVDRKPEVRIKSYYD